jgi:hypothetical protein
MLKQFFLNYKNVFAWSYKELKGIPRKIYEHKIELLSDVRTIKQ